MTEYNSDYKKNEKKHSNPVHYLPSSTVCIPFNPFQIHPEYHRYYLSVSLVLLSV